MHYQWQTEHQHQINCTIILTIKKKLKYDLDTYNVHSFTGISVIPDELVRDCLHHSPCALQTTVRVHQSAQVLVAECVLGLLRLRLSEARPRRDFSAEFVNGCKHQDNTLYKMTSG